MERHSLEETRFLRWLKKLLLIVDKHPSLWLLDTVILVLIAFVSLDNLRKLLLVMTFLYAFASLVSNLKHQSLVCTVSDDSALRKLIYLLLVLLVASLASCLFGWIVSPVVVDYSKLSQKQMEIQALYLIFGVGLLYPVALVQSIRLFFIVFSTRRLIAIFLVPVIILILILNILMSVVYHCFLHIYR